MAKNTRFSKVEFDALLDSIRDQATGHEFFHLDMRDQLEKIRKRLEKSHEPPQREGDRVRGKRTNVAASHLVASRALWEVCDEYLMDAVLGLKTFEDTFVTKGVQGYKTFRSKVETAVLTAVQKVLDSEGLDAVQQEDARLHYTKFDGWVDNALMELPKFAMDNVVNQLEKGVGVAESSDPRVQQWGFLPGKRTALERWSQFLKDCRSGPSIRVAGQTNDGMQIILDFQKKKREIHPSRIAGGQKSLVFIEKDQVTRGSLLGEGSYGKVHLCILQGIPYIPTGTQCYVKTWIPTTEPDDCDQRRKSAISEAILGGLDHLGIVSAFAMTTSDPPDLIYDCYNGGTLRDMIDRVKRSKWPAPEDFTDNIAKRLRAEIDLHK